MEATEEDFQLLVMQFHTIVHRLEQLRGVFKDWVYRRAFTEETKTTLEHGCVLFLTGSPLCLLDRSLFSHTQLPHTSGFFRIVPSPEHVTSHRMRSAGDSHCNPTVTNRHKPLQTVTNRYKPLQTVTNRY